MLAQVAVLCTGTPGKFVFFRRAGTAKSQRNVMGSHLLFSNAVSENSLTLKSHIETVFALQGIFPET